ncbi:MAG: hypothetical protein K2Q14_01370 [Gammaproteobacteria bacterium]|nr:hypothetical protein [Gammaproteobacteria bacterium]
MKKQDKSPLPQGTFMTADEIHVSGTMTNIPNKIKFSKGMGKEATDAHRETLMNRLTVEKEKQDLGLPHRSYISARKIKAADMNNIEVDIEAVEEEREETPPELFPYTPSVMVNPGQAQGHFAPQSLLPSSHSIEVEGITYQRIDEKVHTIELDYIDLELEEEERTALQTVIQTKAMSIFGYIKASAMIDDDCVTALSFTQEKAAKRCQELIKQEVLRLKVDAFKLSLPKITPSLIDNRASGGEKKKTGGNLFDDEDERTSLIKQGDVHGQMVQVIGAQYIYTSSPSFLSPLPKNRRMNNTRQPISLGADDTNYLVSPLNKVPVLNQPRDLSSPFSLSSISLPGASDLENIINLDGQGNVEGQVNTLPLLTLAFIEQHQGNLYVLFRELVKKGYDWRTLLERHLFNTQFTPNERKECDQVVQTLIQKRDELDKVIYKEAIKLLMNDREGAENYQYNRLPKNTGPNHDATGYKLQYYVWQVVRTEGNNDIPLFTVSIQAPGSRDLTSDIDTSIQVECHQTDWVNDAIWPHTLPETFWPALFAPLSHEMDVGAAAEAAIMAYFNKISFEELGLTSATSRDSNVYSKGFLHPDVALKFNPDALIKRELLQSFEKETFYTEYKQKKQVLELAASLFSLREYYRENQAKWQEEIIDKLSADWHGTPNTMEMGELIEQVAELVEDFYTYKNGDKDKKGALAAQLESADFLAKLEAIRGAEGLKLPLSASLIKQDNEIYALQLLYAKQTFDLASVRFNLKQVASHILQTYQHLQTCQANLETCDKDILELEAGLANNPAAVIEKAIRAEIKTKKEERVTFFQALQKEEKAYREGVAAFLEAHQKQQKAIIIANLFAHEGYVNDSAVYHTVAWQQSQDVSLRIDRRHVVLCSVLQQMGFRLLHAKQYEAQQMNSGEILYRTAKYDQRVADMVWGPRKQWFNDHPYQAGDSLLSRLKAPEPLDNRVFHEALFPLLNRSLALIKEVKKKAIIPVYQKPYEALLVCFRYYAQDFRSTHDELVDKFEALLLPRNKKRYQQFEKWLKSDKEHLLKAAITIFKLAFQSKIVARSSEAQLVRPEQYGSAKAIAWGHLFNSLPVQQKSSSNNNNGEQQLVPQ